MWIWQLIVGWLLISLAVSLVVGWVLHEMLGDQDGTHNETAAGTGPGETEQEWDADL